MANQRHCKHKGCSCLVPSDRAADGKDTCSDFCAAHVLENNTRHSVREGCGCAHPGCAVQPGAQL